MGMAAIAPSEVWICIRPTAFARLHRTDRLQANPWRSPSRLLESRLNSNRLPHARSTCVIAHSEASDGEKPQRSLKKTSRNAEVGAVCLAGWSSNQDLRDGHSVDLLEQLLAVARGLG